MEDQPIKRRVVTREEKEGKPEAPVPTPPPVSSPEIIAQAKRDSILQTSERFLSNASRSIEENDHEGLVRSMELLNKLITNTEKIGDQELFQSLVAKKYAIEEIYEAKFGTGRTSELAHPQAEIRGNTELATSPDEAHDNDETVAVVAPQAILENSEETEGVKSLEYDSMRNDLQMLGKALQESRTIMDLTESDFVSEYGRRRWRELRPMRKENIKEKGFFNHQELQIIGDEIEKQLSERKS